MRDALAPQDDGTNAISRARFHIFFISSGTALAGELPILHSRQRAIRCTRSGKHDTDRIPQQADRSTLRLGMSGAATVFAENAGVIGIIAWILIWISAYTAYL